MVRHHGEVIVNSAYKPEGASASLPSCDARDGAAFEQEAGPQWTLNLPAVNVGFPVSKTETQLSVIDQTPS